MVNALILSAGPLAQVDAPAPWVSYRLLADLVVVAHLLFVLFVIGGGLLALRWRRVAWLHLPAAAWGGIVELQGWICPLTYLENHLRRLGGENGYDWPFITRTLEPVLYPVGLTRPTQVVMGSAVLAFNALLYAHLWRRTRRQRQS